jgi:type IV pilus assembly protein PilW
VGRRTRGFQLVELMIALMLGLFLVAAFLSALGSCRSLFATQESVARLQDAGRQALSVLVPDIEHAGFLGFAGTSEAQVVRAGAVVASGAQLREPGTGETVAPVPGLPAGAHDCGVNFAVDLSRTVEGSDGAFVSGSGATACSPTAAAHGARAGADSLTIRHASLVISPPHAGRVQTYSRRFASQLPLEIFADGNTPGAVDDDHEIRDLEVHTYYVANSAVDRAAWPALRVKSLTESGGAAQFRDEEVLPGVEDLQVEFGVTQGSGVRYVPPGAPLPDGERIVAVRLWLRIRADSTEGGFRDDRPLDYAGVHFVPSALEATQRRALVERTVALRNSS